MHDNIHVKTYISTQLTFTANFYPDDGGKPKRVHFVNGKFSTDDAELQAHIEGLDGFGKYITVGPNAPTPLEIKASQLRAEADLADDQAAAAEKTYNDFVNAPKKLRAAADAADVIAKAAEDAVAKENAPAATAAA